MLSQRTVARFQRFLSQLMQPDYILGQALDVPTYYNKLFEYDLPRRVLDAVGKKTSFSPFPLTLYLYEGYAVAAARGMTQPNESDRQLSATYLLCFMAVAIQHYSQLPWERKQMYSSDELLESLRMDGYVYSNGFFAESATGDTIRPVSLDGNAPRAILPAKAAPATNSVETSRAATETLETPSHLKRDIATTLGILGLIVALLAIVVGIFNVEVNHWLKGLWWQLFH